jgi:hypothetical protein
MNNSVYWERQSLPDSCRMHALNAVIGRQAYTWTQFLGMCDSFDNYAKQPIGTSRTFYFGGDDLTLFGFGLQHAKSSLKSIPIFGFTGKPSVPAPPELLADAVAAFVYSRGHVWAARKSVSTGQWLRIDSLSGVAPSPRFADEVSRQGLGLELVFENKADIAVVPESPVVPESLAVLKTDVPNTPIKYPTFLRHTSPAVVAQRISAPPLFRYSGVSTHSQRMLIMRSQTGMSHYAGRR